MKPRVLHISVTAGSDPTGGIALQLASAAGEAGFDSHITYGRGKPAVGVESTCIASNIDLAVHGLATRLLDRHAILATASQARLRQLIDSYRPNLIHLHNLHGYYIALPGLCRTIAERAIPTVLTLHDMWPLTGHCAVPGHCRAYAQGCGTPSAECRTLYPASMLMSRARQNYQAKAEAFALIPRLSIVAPSQAMMEALRQSHLRDRSAHLIYNGIDLHLFQPGESRSGSCILAVAKRWTKEKGLDHLVKLATLLPDHLPLQVVGELPHGCRNILHDQHIGPVTPQLLAHLYRTAVAVVLPTQGESFSLVKAEALASGTPVAAFDAGAAAEFLEAPIGKSVSPGDVEALAQAAIDLAALPKPTTQCRAIAQRYYDIREMQRQYIALYKELLDS